ncbi:tRNA pseudouridine synthase-like 1 isoform X2 [Lycorma delicatula]|uniref:tRNA pseudouridine synthase-like 1 isoform X2 n=1 Tax=Lycorma delicatula TaxID=130591 RepID=UPI003F5172FF
MKRYLMYFSYIGSGFRGVQRQIPREIKALNPVPTVAETIETAFKSRFRLEQLPILHHASRILSFQRVKDDFNSRRDAVRRSYLYRFAIRKPDIDVDVDPHIINMKYYLPYPITEYCRCHFLQHTEFNLDAVNEVLPLFVGTKDFRTFMASIHNKKLRKYLDGEINTVRTLESIELSPGKPLLPSPVDDNYTYWDFKCTAKSFLYKQVRRMVTTFLAVASGKLNYDDVKYMFDNPSADSWKSTSIGIVPSYGLYLTDIIYNKEDLIEPVENEEEKELVIKSSDIKTNPKDLVGLTINEKINLRNEKLLLEKRELKSKNVKENLITKKYYRNL